MRKAKFNFKYMGSYRSSNKFPYGYTLLAGMDHIEWGDETPKEPSEIESIGDWHVVQKDFGHREAVPPRQGYHDGYRACDCYSLIMQYKDTDSYLILDHFEYNPEKWSEECKAAQIKAAA